MNKLEIINKVTRTFHKGLFQLKKHSPEILVIGGTIGTVVAGVMACKATTKVSGILEEAKTKIDDIHAFEQNEELKQKYVEKYGEEYTEQQGKKELAIVYAKAGFDLVKTYAPAVTVGAASITAILAGNNILRKRAAAFAAAYATVDSSFKEYRGRVVERFGKELDQELRYNIKSKEIQQTVVDEKGNETTVTTTVQEMNPGPKDEFTRIFDETSDCWQRDSGMNFAFLMQQQNFLNEKLQRQGFLCLNDALHALGFQRSSLGQVMGWVYDEGNPDFHNVVDFGIFDKYDREKCAFINGWEKSVWIQFNVDGNLLELMP